MIPLIKNIRQSGNNPFFLIAGPCVVESEDMVMSIAEEIYLITEKLDIPLIFKSSYKKANRSRLDSFTGIGDERALLILKKVGETFHVPVVTDVHSAEEALIAASFVDMLQIPAFLSRQTELLVAAAKTGRWINIKKGQFMSPESMRFAVEKVRESGNVNIVLTDRGTMFGYEDLIVDYRGIPEMQKNSVPVVLDITHSLQRPNQASGISGGRPELISLLGRAGIAAGVDGIFLETHPNPNQAKSDGANMLPLGQLENLLVLLSNIRQVIMNK